MSDEQALGDSTTRVCDFCFGTSASAVRGESDIHLASERLHGEPQQHRAIGGEDAGGKLWHASRHPAQEVRTFGQQVTHVASYNFLWCSQAKGEKNPSPPNLDKLTSKAESIKVLNDAFAYCDTVYSALTDASGTEVIDVTQENGRQTRSLRMGLLTLNYGHNNEIYGSIVSYLRMKNIVPPASEPRTPPKQ